MALPQNSAPLFLPPCAPPLCAGALCGAVAVAVIGGLVLSVLLRAAPRLSFPLAPTIRVLGETAAAQRAASGSCAYQRTFLRAWLLSQARLTRYARYCTGSPRYVTLSGGPGRRLGAGRDFPRGHCTTLCAQYHALPVDGGGFGLLLRSRTALPSVAPSRASLFNDLASSTAKPSAQLLTRRWNRVFSSPPRWVGLKERAACSS